MAAKCVRTHASPADRNLMDNAEGRAHPFDNRDRSFEGRAA